MNGEDEPNTFAHRALRLWGMVFRAAFIAGIGFVGYQLADQPGMENIPIGDLTLKQVGGRLLAMGIAAACGYWFFKFPDPGQLEGLPYADWGKLGLWIVGLAVGGAVLWTTVNGTS